MPSLIKDVTSSLWTGTVPSAMRAIVDSYMGELTAQSVFFKALRQGKVTPEIMATVLETIVFALRYTPVHLQRAEAEAKRRNLSDLAEFFKEKAIEEFRHEDWALEDLKALPCSPAAKRAAAPVKGVIELMDYLGGVIKTNPINYLAYIFANEYIAATVFPEIINNLEKMCGINRNQVSVLTKHMELDQQHGDDDEAIINQHFLSKTVTPEERRRKTEFFATLLQSLAFYEQMVADFSLLLTSKK